MNEKNKRPNIDIELEVGEEALKAAKALLDTGLHRDAISRLYYSLFHHVRALLFLSGLEPKTHEGLERLFGLHFVKTSKVNPKYGKLLSRLQKYREQSDYGLTVTFSKEDVEATLKEVEEFIQQVKRVIGRRK